MCAYSYLQLIYVSYAWVVQVFLIRVCYRLDTLQWTYPIETWHATPYTRRATERDIGQSAICLLLSDQRKMSTWQRPPHLLVDTQYPLNKIASIQSITKFCGSVIIGFLSLSFDVFSNVFLKENPLSHRFHWNTFLCYSKESLSFKMIEGKRTGIF